MTGGVISATAHQRQSELPTVAFSPLHSGAGSGVGCPATRLRHLFAISDQPVSQVGYAEPSGPGIGLVRPLTARGTWGSSVFTSQTPGCTPSRFSARRTPTTFLATFSASTVLMQSVSAGSASPGQAVQANLINLLNTRRVCARFRLETIAYESGISIGGDFWKRPIQAYCCFDDPRVRDMNNDAMDMFTRAGGSLNIWGVYSYWPNYDFVGADARPLVRSIVDMANRLPVEASNGLPIPATLTTNTLIKFYYTGADSKLILTNRGDWAGWLVVCPKTRRYCRARQCIRGACSTLKPTASPSVRALRRHRAHRSKCFNQGQHGIPCARRRCMHHKQVLVMRMSPASARIRSAPGTYQPAQVTISTHAGPHPLYDGSTPQPSARSMPRGPGRRDLPSRHWRTTSIATATFVSGRIFQPAGIITDTLPLGTLGGLGRGPGGSGGRRRTPGPRRRSLPRLAW